MNRKRLTQWLGRFTKTRILVVGDLILDEYVWGTVDRISPEAPVPVVWVERESAMPGGAANVANNIRALGGQVTLLGVVGHDERGERLRQELARCGIATDGIFSDAGRPTVGKTRVIAHHQQVVRIDRERLDPVEGKVLESLLNMATDLIPTMDGIILEDYGKGLIQPSLLKPVVALAKRHKKILMVDPKEEHFALYRGVTGLTPNKKEASLATGIRIRDEESLLSAGAKMMKRLKPEVLLVTLGEEGMCLFSQDGTPPIKIPTVAREVFDVSGAGDTVIAVFTLAKAAGASFLEAAQLANAAAGVVVGKVGTATCSPEELMEQVLACKNRWLERN